jgi:hypothetical protein
MSRGALVPLLAVAVAVAACEQTPGSGAPSSGGPPGATVIDPAMTVGSSPSPTPDPAAPAAIDPTLLELLPETVGGAPVTEAIDEAAAALADRELATIASALDVGLALDEATGNLVTAHVVRLREGAFNDATFRQWRDSYDDGACAAAGGVDARAQAPIGGRDVFVTSCLQALRAYHVWIPEENVVISASSVGEGRFGELLLGTLRLPE